MQTFLFLSTIWSIFILAVISPGPDFFIVLRNALSYSRRAGIFTALGIAVGLIFHLAYCLAGIAVLISQSAILFNVLKFCGALYLTYLGIVILRSKPESIAIKAETKTQEISAWAAFRQGLLTNILNPKVTLFFLSLFTLAIPPQTPMTQTAIAAAGMLALATIWFCFVAYFFTLKPVQKSYEKSRVWFDRVFGVLLIGLGVKVGFFTD